MLGLTKDALKHRWLLFTVR